MKNTWRALAMLLLPALLLSVVQPVLAQEAAPDPHGLRFDAPEYAIDGPYAVGVRYFTIPAETDTDRELTATVWYPALQGDEQSEFVYEQQFEPGQLPPNYTIGHASLDAEPDGSGAPYPLVVYSHSQPAFGQEIPYLTEHLASRGFVVISVDHEDNWSTGFGPMAYQTLMRRSQEISREIDYAESLSASDGALAGLIDTERVAVAGWSMGGVTALLAAGARLNLDENRTWCADNPVSAENNTPTCVDVMSQEAELAAYAGLEEVPEGLWPDWGDERVDAVVSLAGPTNLFGSKGIQSVDVPALFMVGSGETAVDLSFEMAKPFDSVGSERKSQIVFDHGEHIMFFSSCADSPSIVELGFPMFCSDPVWDMDRAHDLINHFATAFLNAELKGDAEAAAALAPEAVSFPGIEYQAEGYGPAVEVAEPAPLEVRHALAAVNDVILYYETAGEGEPVLLLPGGTMCTDAWAWTGIYEALGPHFKIIAPDSRAQGRSTDSDQPLTYQLMADDAVALLDHLGIESAHVVGWSDGATTGLDMTMRYPERVRSLVVTGPQAGVDGLTEEEYQKQLDFSLDNLDEGWSEFLDYCYTSIAPDPEHLPVMLAKIRDMWLQPEFFDAAGLADISIPVLFLEGAVPDVIRLEHIEKIAAEIPNAQMQWIEGTGHSALMDKPEEWTAGVLAFLEAQGAGE